ncbi:ROK family protein [Flavobacterium sp.]|uniref:ROK family protein n=1 Tax=Flavobacterium sp. TaxID=239 RepID=UPI003795ABFB
MDSILLGIDIGGTNLKVGRVENSTIVAQTFSGVNINSTKEEILNSLFMAIDRVINSDVTAIGIGVPAVVDPITGIVYDVQNIPSWKEVALKELVEQYYKLPVYINNDANCFALGEKIYGKGKGFENFIGLSIGTGIGMGIIINNRLYNGVLCGAGEVGMLAYKDGIMEDFSSGHFFRNHYNSSAEEMSQKAAEGNKIALEAFAEFGLHLGECLKAILYTYAPEAIILGGSISKAFPYFKKSMEASLKTFAYQKQIQNLKIETSNHEAIAILGAASLCF